MAVESKTTDTLTGKSVFTPQYYKTELCTDLYKDTGSDPRLIDQFMPYTSMTDSLTYDWYCPVIPDIEVQNDPRVDLDGVASYFVVNYCDLAAANLGYEDGNCKTDHI